jgi:pimeloyl-ACP methyl ester carboxylesterase
MKAKRRWPPRYSRSAINRLALGAQCSLVAAANSFLRIVCYADVVGLKQHDTAHWETLARRATSYDVALPVGGLPSLFRGVMAMGREHTAFDGDIDRAGASAADDDMRAPAYASRLPTVIMIPGTLCDARIFARQKRALRGVADVRMVGYEDLSPTRDWADHLLARLPTRFSVVGFSLGGLWALELLRKAPQRIERLAMVASNAHGASRAGQRKSAWLWKMWRASGPDDVARHVKPDYFHHEIQRRRHARLVHDMAMGTGRKAAFAEFEWAATRPDGRGELARFDGPLLLVSGDRDRLCTPAMQRAMVQAQPRARWLELPRVGHFVPLEAGARMGAALRHWMSQPPAGIAAPYSDTNTPHDI